MDKKKIVFIVITVISVVASLIACALGLPYTPIEIDYGWTETDSTDSAPSGEAEVAYADSVTEGGVSAVTGTV